MTRGHWIICLINTPWKFLTGARIESSIRIRKPSLNQETNTKNTFYEYMYVLQATYSLTYSEWRCSSNVHHVSYLYDYVRTVGERLVTAKEKDLLIWEVKGFRTRIPKIGINTILSYYRELRLCRLKINFASPVNHLNLRPCHNKSHQQK